MTRARRKDGRHRAREAALQILYQWEVGRTGVDQAIDTFFSRQWPDAQPPPAEVRRLAVSLARDTVGRLEAIDPLIAAAAEHWRPERMAILDRLILRMAVGEMLGGSTPPAVVINEAVELARTFSTDDSVKFTNGVLDAIRRKIESR